MRVEFDPTKDAGNVAKHGVSLARADELVVGAIISSGQDFFGGERFRAYGLLDGRFHVLVFTYRGDVIRAISLRRAGREEYEDHVERR